MKNIIIAANWKSNKNVPESIAWLSTFGQISQDYLKVNSNISVIICAPYINLYPLKEYKNESDFPVVLGAQDISPYPDGAYTGQISAHMLESLVDWVIIGHSERRKLFSENENDLAKKVENAKKAGLKVIYCISSETMSVPSGVDIVAYEPLWAIGTGKTDTPENAGKVLGDIKAKTGINTALYGGSVTSDNVFGFINQTAIDGVLIGGASLDANKFFTLIKNASSNSV